MTINVRNKKENKPVDKKKSIESCPFEIGNTYIFRTVTMCNIGKVIGLSGNFLILDDDTVWIADTGRWSECLSNPKTIKKVEPFRKIVMLNIDMIVDATPWEFAIPSEDKECITTMFK